ncbi:MAG TPA: thioesterase, partial [Chitinophagaceae bacterium]|nr:thioesterase [Chitinophagaceae bacterium]
MSQFTRAIEIRWSDLDPNQHLRHSVYYDWGAYMRMVMLSEAGMTTQALQQIGIGPILLREECVFRRELHFGDAVSINVQLVRCKRDMSRWTMRHEIYKNGDTLSAIITIDGAWIDIAKRKLAVPP